MKKVNAFHGPAIDAYIVPDTDEHQVINIIAILTMETNLHQSFYTYVRIKSDALLGELWGYFSKSAVLSFDILNIKY